MYGNNFYNPSMNIERLNRQKDEIENLIKTYQNMNNQPQPINNFINTSNKDTSNSVVLNKLNDGDEVENIMVTQDTIFIGTNRMQIKKLDGTIEKYNIEKYYPIDERDKMIKELNDKVSELERKLNNEPTINDITTTKCDKSTNDVAKYVKSKSKTNSEPIQGDE